MRRGLFRPAIIAFTLAAMIAGSGAARAAEGAYHPAFQPGRHKAAATARPNAVLVLGTPHLSGLPDSFRAEALAPLLDRLAAWRPTAIAIENLSGLQCDSLRRSPSRYAATVKDYCPDTSAAGEATGLDVPAANAAAERMLADWPAAPLPAQRRRLAALFLAAGEPASALVQWLRLPPAERKEGEGIDAALRARLDTLEHRRNESFLVAAALAARLGLERVWSVDDHSADQPDPADPKAYEAAIMAAWNNPAAAARRAEDQRLEAGAAQPGGLMALYRAHNDPAAAEMAYRSDFGAALAEPSPQGFGRAYVGWWETRNLRMVANIREVLAQRPGTRLLAIVGASHKGYYEAYLDQMHDVALVDAAAVLR
ncbi:DUF5694 domain-containing protein [Sphingomonas sanxanigenens]|uniref:Haem-binding uptake Tiki superfamily ChaN domain-containing protein n=1 Tax=Sphingomonas sanxanigenens DSM 19645 = NX02 TaxID=1123269 RepID=W0A639_9SPHN|nr:DUF5694 domain-containing protein [Sphingomonas sanxanigenens]AHE51942.1 hypothetical protein NX02_00880 [Sphingomonas sanxanigenens DSM 19645 = NX02]